MSSATITAIERFGRGFPLDFVSDPVGIQLSDPSRPHVEVRSEIQGMLDAGLDVKLTTDPRIVKAAELTRDP